MRDRADAGVGPATGQPAADSTSGAAADPDLSVLCRGLAGRWATVLDHGGKAVLVIGLLLTIAAAVVGAGASATFSDGGFATPATESGQQNAAERAVFGARSVDVVAVYSSPTMTANDRAFRAAVDKTVAKYPKDAVAAVDTYYTTRSPAMVSSDGHAVQVLISLRGDGSKALSDSYQQLRPYLTAITLGTQLTGPYPLFEESNQITQADLLRAELISIPLVLLLALVIFGSVVAALMPLMVGVVAVLGAMAALHFIGDMTDVSSLSVNVVTLLGLGLAVDYALFVVSRFREELDARPTDYDSHAVLTVTMRTAGRTVLVSALTVAAALSSLLVFPQAILRSIAYGGIAAVLVAALAAVTLLPAALAVLGHRINAWPVPIFAHRKRGEHADAGRWERFAEAVMRRPKTCLVVVVVILVALGLPFLGARWAGSDYHVLPPSAKVHQDSVAVAQEFGVDQSTANIMVTGANDATVNDYVARLRIIPGVRGADLVTSVKPGAQAATPHGTDIARDGAWLVRVGWSGGSQSDDSQALVRTLRATLPPYGGKVQVGGPTAETVDMLDTISGGLPAMLLVVVAVMLVLLFLAFGSVVLPVKAVLMSAVSMFASFGVVTWVFGDGHLEKVLGFSSTGALDPTVPILMLAVLFGLSMDYEVFLLSRVRDEWDATGDNTRSVAVGLAKTGRIITSAALLLALVVGAFALSGMLFMKVLGIGMLVALLVDATLVRAVLVPATMKLLGDWNWWTPRWLRPFSNNRFLRHTEEHRRSDPQRAAEQRRSARSARAASGAAAAGVGVATGAAVSSAAEQAGAGAARTDELRLRRTGVLHEVGESAEVTPPPPSDPPTVRFPRIAAGPQGAPPAPAPDSAGGRRPEPLEPVTPPTDAAPSARPAPDLSEAPTVPFRPNRPGTSEEPGAQAESADPDEPGVAKEPSTSEVRDEARRPRRPRPDPRDWADARDRAKPRRYPAAPGRDTRPDR
ncbi:efflux RND transporter permease subunit [Tsukamurella sp. 8F]|uniref:MMPL family transporter n=1 Tax=unclassified Tsukamurella TaxID=2633480 RepID=UPI0023B9DAB8|nr:MULTISPECIES: efflux RND transporter permease subunit [unclassified Tsukamurella]MDF0530330.1 efflux RND transporter permease subunit [Tsukamurella sp. 8J]MDF0587627.1 efflux RND transporter permease subunit [Tsukamurella sp. 8F]